MDWENTLHRLSLLGMAFVAGWAACTSFYNLPALWQAKEKLPYVQSVAGCQTKRAQIATRQAVLSETGGDANLASIINCPQLPHPQVAPVRK